LVNPRDSTLTYPELHVESAQSRATPGCTPLSQAAAACSGIAAKLTIPYPASLEKLSFHMRFISIYYKYQIELAFSQQYPSKTMGYKDASNMIRQPDARIPTAKLNYPYETARSHMNLSQLRYVKAVAETQDIRSDES
jgi:hypothetical protein